MKFFCIGSSNISESEERSHLLEQTCVCRNIPFVFVDAVSFQCEEKLIPKKGDCLYRVYPDRESRTVEKVLMNEGVSSFFDSSFRGIVNVDNVIAATLLHSKNKLPIPKTAYGVPDDMRIVRKTAEQLGGFPLILKIAGGSKGIGVMKVDSLSCLVSLVNFLNAKNQDFVLREYIDVGTPAHTYRAIVVGNELVFSYQNISTDKNDFRSNVNQKKRQRVEFGCTEEQKKILVRAVNVLGVEIGAVDFVLDAQRGLIIFEVNRIFNFIPIIRDFQFPIHEKIVNYLVEKSKKITSSYEYK